MAISVFYSVVVVLLVILSAISAGLQIALFSIDSIVLRVWSTAGDDKQKKMSKKLLKFFNAYHYTLVSLILFNSSCMMTLPVVLKMVVSPFTALILSITVVLFVGEVIPLAFFVRHAILICSFFSPLIRFCVIITTPISYPVSKILDYFLGSHEELLDRDELAALILPTSSFGEDNTREGRHSSHQGREGEEVEMVVVDNPTSSHSGEFSRYDASLKREEEEQVNAFRLRETEICMLQGAMQLTRDTIVGHMRSKLDEIFMLSSQQPLDQHTIEAIIASGFSRIPVYFGEDRSHVIGALIVNSLVKLCFAKPDPPPLVSNYPLREVMRLPDSSTLYDAYIAFRDGNSNMAVVYNSFGVMVGLLTLTDVLTAIYQGGPSEEKVIVAQKRTDKMVGVMEGMKYLSHNKQISSLLVTFSDAAAVKPQVSVGSERFGSPGSLGVTSQSAFSPNTPSARGNLGHDQ